MYSTPLNLLEGLVHYPLQLFDLTPAASLSFPHLFDGFSMKHSGGAHPVCQQSSNHTSIGICRAGKW